MRQSLAESDAQTVFLETELESHRQRATSNKDACTNTPMVSNKQGLEEGNKKQKQLSDPNHTEICGALRDKIKTLEDQLSDAKGEILSLSEQLSLSESAKGTLESGKSRARTEIHSLLHRVQESESWQKRGEDVLRKLGILHPGDSSRISWRIMEERLQNMIDTGIQGIQNDRQEGICPVSEGQ